MMVHIFINIVCTKVIKSTGVLDTFLASGGGWHRRQCWGGHLCRRPGIGEAGLGGGGRHHQRQH